MPGDPILGQLLLFVVLGPLVAALPVALLSRRAHTAGGVLAGVATGLVLAAAVVLAASEGTVSARLPAMLGSIDLRADAAGRIFVLVSAFVWFCTSVYAVGYLRGDTAAGRLRAVGLVLLSANLGVFVAGDWLSLLIFFEILGIVGLLFVIHGGDSAARRAGMKYFWLTLLGGVALLGGIALLYGAAGSFAIAPFPDSSAAAWAAGLMMVGFGVKAGMLGLHVWLPDAHSVAPAPASALLSGVMIKAGAFGIFRCLGQLGEPELARQFGIGLMSFGLAGMLVGAVAALAQSHAKRLLAWSSISQMGFILAALGAGAVLGAATGGDARAAGLMHALNHALFKSALFLGVGALVHAAGSADLQRLAGAGRGTPLLAAAMLVAVAGIVGIPGFNGFASKTLVHHALAQLGEIEAQLAFVETVYYAASIGTAAMFARLVYFLLIARPAGGETRPLPIAPYMSAATWLLAVPIVLVGLWPAAAFEFAIAPAASSAHSPHLSPADAVGAMLIAAAGIGVARLAQAARLADRRLPAFMTIDAGYRLAGRSLAGLCASINKAAASLRRAGSTRLVSTVAYLRRALRFQWVDSTRVVARGASLRMPHDQMYRSLDEQRDRIVARALELAGQRDGGRRETSARKERMLDATRHYAGWLGTRLINAGLRLQFDAGMAVAQSGRCSDRLAECAVSMAVSEVESGHRQRALALADDVLDGLLGPHREPPEPPMPYRHWLKEMRSILFSLLTDASRRHWPASENLSHGALVSNLRGRLQRLARDPGVGLALTAVTLLLVFALARWAF